MSVNSQDTYVNILTPLSVVGSGGGGIVSSFSTIYVSTANVDYLNTIDITNFFLSTQIIEAEEAFISSISTFGLYLDGSLLTTVGNELLLNGIPIATTSNISSLADWSYDPAVSTLNMNGNSSINASLTSTNVIQAGNGFINNLVCGDISTVTLTVISTLHDVSTISSLVIEAQAGFFSTINGVTFPQNTVSAETGSISSLTTSSINGVQFPGPNSDVSQWANFPALSTISGGSGATDDLRIAASRSLGISANVSTGIVVDRGIDVGGPASFNVLTKNGSKGAINLTSDPGFAGLYGEINLTANGGTTPGLVASGGLIQLTANTPIGTTPAASSAIKFSAAGINSYAGAVPSFGSLLGYNFIYGTLGVNLCAGLPSVLPNVPGTTYLYGTSGITLGSQTNTGSDITQSAGGLYTTLVTGYWAGGVFSPQDLVIRGRQIPIYGNSYVKLSNVDVLSFDSGASKAITGLSTINGIAYPPVAASIPANLVVSSLVAAVVVSTPSLLVSSVNGSLYPPVFEPPANVIVSTLTAADYVSTGKIYGLSTLYGQSVTNNIFFDPNGGMTFNNDGADMIVDNAGSLTVRTDLIIPAYNLYVSSILGVSSINGTAWPPVYEPPANAVVSTLTAANSISTPALFVSSVNGYSVNTPVVSTLTTSTLSAYQIDTTKIIANNFVIPTNVGDDGYILLNETAQDPFISHSLIAQAYPYQGAPGPDTQYLRLQFIQNISTTAFTPVYYSDIAVGPSTLGNIATGILYLGQSGNNLASIKTSPNNSTIYMTGTVSISSLSDISTINGVAYPSSASVPPNLTVSTLTLPAVGIINIGGDNVITYGPAGTLNIAASSQVFISSPLSVADITVSSINGSSYPPAVAGIQSTIANAGSFVDIDSGGNISSFSGGSTSITANSGGVHLIDADNITTLDVMFDITMTPTSGGSVKINQAPLYVSSIFISSVNGALYPPPSAGGSANGEFSTITVSSFVSTRQLSNLSSINNIIQIGSFGELVAYQMAATNGANFAGNVQIPQLASVSSINSGIILTTNTITTNLMSTFTLNAIEIANLSTINGAPYRPSTFTEASISSLTVSSINDNQVQGPVWASGGTYSNPNVTFTANTNTLISYTSTTTTTSTAKNMIFATFEATTTATGTIYMTIARSVIPPTAVSSFNLTNGTSALTNAINGNGLSMWGSAFNTSRLTAYASVVDTPGAPGTYYYSIWGYDTAAITTTTSELTCLTVLNVAP
jgi:hypothetical protein